MIEDWRYVRPIKDRNLLNFPEVDWHEFGKAYLDYLRRRGCGT